MIPKFFKNVVLLAVLLLAFGVEATAEVFPSEPAAKILVDKIGDARAAGSVSSQQSELFDEYDQLEVTSWARREYVGKNGQRLSVTLLTTHSDAQAYAMLSTTRFRVVHESGGAAVTSANVGTDAFYYADGVGNSLRFFKGNTYVGINDNGSDVKPLLEFGRALAETIDKGEGEIPSLVKHLPDWPNVQNNMVYFATKERLNQLGGSPALIETLSFAGGAEAVTARYQDGWMLLVEFYTPQLATENHSRIVAKIAELRSQGQAVPTAYRRVGNYSVFVFDASNEQVANQLIDQVKYEQLVQWLGKNPNIYDRAANEFTRTTLGVFIAVVKASGLALILSLGIGGVVGAVLFSIRRKQKQAYEAYTDAGGMLRLNLDEITPGTDPARLIGPGN